MESTITGIAGEVTGRTVNTRNGQAPIFDVTIGSQKVSTFKANIAEQAKALQGSTVSATVDVTERNGYTNHTLLAVNLVDALPSTNGSSKSTIPVSPPENYQREQSPETVARITRLSCLSTAFQYAAASGDSVEGALSLAKTLYGVAMGTETPEPVEALTGAPADSTEAIPW